MFVWFQELVNIKYFMEYSRNISKGLHEFTTCSYCYKFIKNVLKIIIKHNSYHVLISGIRYIISRVSENLIFINNKLIHMQKYI